MSRPLESRRLTASPGIRAAASRARSRCPRDPHRPPPHRWCRARGRGPGRSAGKQPRGCTALLPAEPLHLGGGVRPVEILPPATAELRSSVACDRLIRSSERTTSTAISCGSWISFGAIPTWYDSRVSASRTPARSAMMPRAAGSLTCLVRFWAASAGPPAAIHDLQLGAPQHDRGHAERHDALNKRDPRRGPSHQRRASEGPRSTCASSASVGMCSPSAAALGSSTRRLDASVIFPLRSARAPSRGAMPVPQGLQLFGHAECLELPCLDDNGDEEEERQPQHHPVAALKRDHVA